MPNQITCSGCDAEWTAMSACHCSGCKHRSAYGERGRCLDPAELPGLEFRLGMWRGPEMTEEQKAKRFGGEA